MPQEYVYTGVWSKYDNPARGATLTVTNLASLFLLGGVTILLAFTQARTWMIVRYLVAKSRSAHLTDHLDDVSQWAALKICWEHVKKTPLFRFLSKPDPIQRNRERLEYHVTPWIGLFAALNVLLFVVGGVVMPWLLSDGWLGAPAEVRSRQTDGCLDTWNPPMLQNVPTVLSNILLSEATWGACHSGGKSSSYCDPNFAGTEGYSLKIGTDCPFPGHVCLENQPTVTFTRANVTTHDLGINSRMKLTVSHRLTCGAISMAPFIYKAPQPPSLQPYRGNFTFSIQDPSLVTSASELNTKLSLSMRTDNSLGSGREMLEKGNGFLLDILPAPGLQITPQISDIVHPLLRQPDGQTFVFVLRVGATIHYSTRPIIDPFFSANTLWDDHSFYVPDREATAIGCIEQFQVCFDTKSGYRCYPWMKALMDYPKVMAQELGRAVGMEILLDYVSVFVRSFEFSPASLMDFLQRRTNLRRPLLATIMRLNPSNPQMIANIDIARQWILELDALFSKAVIWQKMSAISVVQNNNDYENMTRVLPGDVARKASLCDRILLIDADYTNIDWMWMWIAIGTLLLLCVISYANILKRSLVDSVGWLREHVLPSLKKTWEELNNLGCRMVAWVGGKYPACLGVLRRGRARVNEIELANNSQALEEEPDNPI